MPGQVVPDQHQSQWRQGIARLVSQPCRPPRRSRSLGHGAELVAQLQASLRRSRSAARNRFGTLVRVRDVALELARLQFHGPMGCPAILTGTQAGLLEYLMYQAGMIVTRDHLLEHVWGDDVTGESNRTDVCIRRLRQKIEPDPAHPAMI